MPHNFILLPVGMIHKCKRGFVGDILISGRTTVRAHVPLNVHVQHGRASGSRAGESLRHPVNEVFAQTQQAAFSADDFPWPTSDMYIPNGPWQKRVPAPGLQRSSGDLYQLLLISN